MHARALPDEGGESFEGPHLLLYTVRYSRRTTTELSWYGNSIRDAILWELSLQQWRAKL